MAVKPYSWLSRKAEARLVTSEQKSQRAIQKILGLYSSARSSIDYRIASIYQNYSDKSGLKVEELQKIMNVSERADFLVSVKRSMQKMGLNIADVYNPRYIARLNRLEAIKQQIYWELAQIAPNEIDISGNTYRNIVETTGAQTFKDNAAFNGIKPEFNSLDTAIVDQIMASRWAGRDFATSVWANAGELARRMPELVGGALIAGQSYSRTATIIKQEFKVARFEAVRLVRTENNYFHNQAELASYVEDGIEFYRLLVTLDGRTSSICIDFAKDNKTYRTDEAVVGSNYPPFHPNCRTTTVAIFAENIREANRINIEANTVEQPPTMQGLEERWGTVDFAQTQGVAGFGKDSITTKLRQGGDKALNAESEWISKTIRGMEPPKQKEALHRLDEIIVSMKDEGQKSQVAMVKKFVEMDIQAASNPQVSGTVRRTLDVQNGSLTLTAEQKSIQAEGLPDANAPYLKANTPELREKVHNDYKVTYTEEQKMALRDYINTGYTDTNAMLRNQTEVTAKGIRLTSDLSDLMETSEAPYNLTVYRGMGSRLLKNIAEGEIFTDNGFVSTSLSRKAVEDGFINKGVDALVEIKIPKGSPSVDVNSVLGDLRKTDLWKKTVEKEQEILLPIASAFRVDDIIQEKNGRNRYIFTLLDLNNLVPAQNG